MVAGENATIKELLSDFVGRADGLNDWIFWPFSFSGGSQYNSKYFLFRSCNTFSTRCYTSQLFLSVLFTIFTS